MNILWKVKRKIKKTLIAHSSNPRPSSYPFISGDTFRSIADHIHEDGRENPDGKGRSFNPSIVKTGEIVFVETHLLEDYFRNIHPRINHPYKLITHNNDWGITEEKLRFIDGKIIHWFAQNVMVLHPKVTPIPIGLESAHYANAGHTPFYTQSLPPQDKRLPKILVGFNIASNVEKRGPIFQTLSSLATVDVLKNRLEQPDYVSTIKKYCFTASPPGNGEDCVRTWEAMLLGTIPIVQNSVGMEYFKNLHLPLWMIDSWDELKNMSDYDLKVKYGLIMSQADKKPLYINFWSDLINSKN